MIRKPLRLHPVQNDYIESNALFRGFVGGRGAGKTRVGAIDIALKAKRNHTYLIGSPTGVLMGDTTFPTFKAVAEDLGIWGECRMSPYPTVTLTTGATIRFRTAEDPDKMRGPNLSGVWLDEASIMHEDAFKICIASLREHGEQGWLGATFTPKGSFHWTYDVFAKPGPDGKSKPNVQLFRSHTRENPFNPKDFANTLAGQYTATFARQELGGEFLDIEGAEWGHEYFPESMWFDQWPEGLYHLVIALDPSKGPNDRAAKRAGQVRESDYSAIVGMARDKDGNLWIEADLERRDVAKMVYDSIAFAKRLREECRCDLEGFGVEGDAFQSLIADSLIPAATRDGYHLPMYKVFSGGVQKEIRIRRLTPAIVQGRLRFRRTPGTRLLVQQMQQFPVGEHDDGPDSLEMCQRLGNQLADKKYGKKGTS